MPLYEYKCDVCGRFEKIVKFSDPPLEACPTCGGAVQKLFSSPAIQFKGSGFYITDYAKKPTESSGGKTSSADGGSSDKSDKSSSDKSSSDKASGEKSSSDKSSSDKSSTNSAASTTTTTTTKE